VIKSACRNEATANTFHTTPFQEMWKQSKMEHQSSCMEKDTSDEMINAYKEVQNIPPDPNYPDVKNVVVAMAAYLDATMLAQFGTTSLSLGARGVIPSGYIESLLRVF
jgi:hypothetical protein